jgi:hypothetical protein
MHSPPVQLTDGDVRTATANYQAALVKDFQTGTRDWPNGNEGRCKCRRGFSRSCSLALVSKMQGTVEPDRLGKGAVSVRPDFIVASGQYARERETAGLSVEEGPEMLALSRKPECYRLEKGGSGRRGGSGLCRPSTASSPPLQTKSAANDSGSSDVFSRRTILPYLMVYVTELDSTFGMRSSVNGIQWNCTARRELCQAGE